MANRAKRPCAYPMCPELVDNGYCDRHRKLKSIYNERRGTAAERGYGSRWQKARKTYLAHHPFCVECQKAGKVEPATVVDHRIPHKGDPVLFWDENNWQGLCKRHHDIKTAKEDGGFGNKANGAGG
jgi:5-methylcytosine-specific restriction protein A